jgi:hypothetical protein
MKQENARGKTEAQQRQSTLFSSDNRKLSALFCLCGMDWFELTRSFLTAVIDVFFRDVPSRGSHFIPRTGTPLRYSYSYTSM